MKLVTDRRLHREGSTRKTIITNLFLLKSYTKKVRKKYYLIIALFLIKKFQIFFVTALLKLFTKCYILLEQLAPQFFKVAMQKNIGY